MIRSLDLADRIGPALHGRCLGRRHLSHFLEVLSDRARGTVIAINFQNVKLVTASWLNQALVPLMHWAADDRNDVFPVVHNLDPKWTDELELVAEWASTPFLVTEGSVSAERMLLVGSLEIGQRETFEAVQEAVEITGAALERMKQDSGVGATAWNNRLKSLYQMRLVRRAKRGREQIYSPVLSPVADSTNSLGSSKKNQVALR